MVSPLSGVKVVDVTRALTGPYCTMMLGDLGADVIKIEIPGRGDDSRGFGPPFQEGESCYFLAINRNKRSVTLDLRKPRGREIALALMKDADVVVENFSPGVADKLGIGYEDVRKINPRIIYSSTSGYGQTGPDADKPAYDLIMQGKAGWMSYTGPVGGPPTSAAASISDLTTAIYAVNAIVAALYRRERSGEGQKIDLSLLQSIIAFQSYMVQSFFGTGKPPTWMGNRYPVVAPYESYETKDGNLVVACANEATWQRLAKALGLEWMMDDPRFKLNRDRVNNREIFCETLGARFAAMTTQEAVELLDAGGVPCGPINNLEQVFQEPQVEHLGLRQKIQHPTIGELDQIGLPYDFSETPAEIRLPPPLLGQHTEEILQTIGLTDADFAELRKDGVI